MSSQEWYTPDLILNYMRYVFDCKKKILDPCSTHENNKRVKADIIFTKEQDAFKQDWLATGADCIFLNPPGVVPGLSRKFLEHAISTGLPTFYVGFSSLQLSWAAGLLDALFFPQSRTKFIPGEGQKVSSPSVYTFIGLVNCEYWQELKLSHNELPGFVAR